MLAKIGHIGLGLIGILLCGSMVFGVAWTAGVALCFIGFLLISVFLIYELAQERRIGDKAYVAIAEFLWGMVAGACIAYLWAIF